MDRNDFGSRIKMLREAKRISMAEFGKQIGVSKSMVEFIESGFKMPSLETTIMIINVLNTTFEYLVYGKEAPKYLNVEGLPEEYIKILSATLTIMRRECGAK